MMVISQKQLWRSYYRTASVVRGLPTLLRKGGEGSGSWNGPGDPRFAWQSSQGSEEDLVAHYNLGSFLGEYRGLEYVGKNKESWEAIRGYTTDPGHGIKFQTHAAVNGALRDGYYDPAKGPQRGMDEEFLKYTVPVIRGLDTAFNKLPKTPFDVTTFRKAYGSEGQFEKLKVGASFKDKGFVSTSLSPDIFSKKNLGGTTKGATKYEFEIRVPKGSKGIYIGKQSMNPKEKEFLLPRGSKFEVVSRKEIGNSTRIVLKVIK